LNPASSTSDSPTNSEEQKEKAKAGEFGKFNDLSVSLSFAITGLIVVFLPGTLNKPFDWIIEGRIIGVTLAIFGAIFILMAAATLTGREGFSNWGIALVIGATIFAAILVLRKYHVPRPGAIALIVFIIVFAFIGAYALVSGFTDFFEEPKAKAPVTATEDDETKERREIGWYERITLVVAAVAMVATVVAAVEPIFH
jgi:hypothetical protein